MAVAFDAVGPAGGAGTNTGTTPLTWTHICGGSATAILIAVTTFTGNSNAVTAVTYGGVSCSLILFTTSGSGSTGGIALYYLDSSGGLPTGSNTVSVNFTGANDTIGGSVSFTGSNGHGTAVNNGANGGASSFTVSVASTTTGGMVVPVACFGGGSGGGTFSGTNSVTVRWQKSVTANTGADNASGGSVPSTGGGASQTVGFSNTQSDIWGMIAVELLPAGAVTTQVPPLGKQDLPNFPVSVIANSGWRNAGHSK